MENKTMDIRQALKELAESSTPAREWDGQELWDLCESARSEIAALDREIETLRHDNGIIKDIVRTLAPELHNTTRHTITVEKPVVLKEGDSLLIQVIPPKSETPK
jgi:hypothetical protein